MKSLVPGQPGNTNIVYLTKCNRTNSLPRSRFLDVTQRSPNALWGSVAWHPKNGCEGDYWTKCCKIMIWAFGSLLRAFFRVPTSWLGRQALASIQLFRSLISLNLLQTLFECSLLLELSLCMTSFAFLFTESSCSTFDELTNTNLYCWGAGKH